MKEPNDCIMKFMVKLCLAKITICTPDECDAANSYLASNSILPVGIFRGKNSKYYKYTYTDMSDTDVDKYLMYKRMCDLETIRNCIIVGTSIVICLLVVIGMAIFIY